jgi:pilus assembly protein CpaE
MADQLTVLLIGADRGALAEIHGRLRAVEDVSVTCTQASFQDGLKLAWAQNPAVVMILTDGDPRTALALTAEISRTLPSTQIFAVSSDDSTGNIVQAMRAGATEFLGLPLEMGQIVKALIKATALQRLSQPMAPKGEIWTVYSPKGGAGVTTTAVNLAIELHGELGKSVCLVDLDFQAGDLALALNLAPVYTMLDIALNFPRLDSVFLEGTLTRHASGISLLAAPTGGTVDGYKIPGEQIRTVLDLLKAMYDVVIVDTARTLSEETIAALRAANRIIVLVERSIPALRGYRRMLEIVDGLDIPRDRLDVVISKYVESKAAVPLDEAKRSLELAVRCLLPLDEQVALEALNKGLALADVRRSSPLRRGIGDLAHLLTAEHDGEGKGRKRRGILGGLFSS